MKHVWTVALAVGASVASFSGAVAAPRDTSHCQVNTYTAWVSQSDPGGTIYYVYGPELWEESNGHPGLQREASPCRGSASLPADTCATHAETWALLNCGVAYAQEQI